MKVKSNRVFQLLIAGLLIFSAFLTPMETVFAESNTVESATITVHKRIWTDAQPTEKQNTGEIMTDFGGDPLPGAEFTLFDVTSQYLTYLSGSDQDTAIKAIQADAAKGVPTYATALETVTTDSEGKGAFAAQALKDADGNYKVYLIMETKTPAGLTVTQIATPIVLAMPIYKLDKDNKYTDQLNKDIHLYPKNVTETDTKELVNESTFDKVTIGGKTYTDVTTGDILDYKLTVHVPANLADIKSFKVTDTPSEGLALVDKTLAVEGLSTPDDYTVTYTDGGFTVDFNLASTKVQALAGKEVVLTCKMKLTAEVDPDKKMQNKANVIIDNNPEADITPKDPIVTGGHKFVKIDKTTGEVLAGAEFVIANADQSKFATFEAKKSSTGEYVFKEWVTTAADATKLITDKNGEIYVKGLVDGTYILNETKAPSDKYILIKDGTTKFTIVSGEYKTSECVIENTKKGILPSTGGTGILAFLIIGAGMMLGAYMWFKKSQANADI